MSRKSQWCLRGRGALNTSVVVCGDTPPLPIPLLPKAGGEGVSPSKDPRLARHPLLPLSGGEGWGEEGYLRKDKKDKMIFRRSHVTYTNQHYHGVQIRLDDHGARQFNFR